MTRVSQSLWEDFAIQIRPIKWLKSQRLIAALPARHFEGCETLEDSIPPSKETRARGCSGLENGDVLKNFFRLKGNLAIEAEEQQKR